METILPPTAPRAPDDGRIPVCLLTGFLGAGKTTLLNRLMGHPEMAGTVLLINEFGEVGIDNHLVETLDDQTVILDSGCLCCTMNGDLIEALKSLYERMSRREIPPIRRVIIETTGLADPVPVVNTLMENRHVNVRYVCDGIVTVVDATLGLDQIARHSEALRQVSIADLLLIGKCDLASRPIRAALTSALARVNPSARVLEMRHGDVGPDDLFGVGLYTADRRARSIDEWLGWTAPAARAPSSPVSGDAPDTRRHGCDHPTHGPACDGTDHGDAPADADGHHGHAHGHGGHHDHDHHPREETEIAASSHGTGIASFVVSFDAPVPWRSLAVAMGQILARFGDRLLRVKGLVRALGEEAPIVVQCVRDNAYAPVKLPRWPQDGVFADRRGRLVFIVEEIGADGEAEIRARLAALPGDTAAVQILARHPNLATRCWLAARLPTLHRGSFETDGWVVMPRRFTTAVRSAAASA